MVAEERGPGCPQIASMMMRLVLLLFLVSVPAGAGPNVLFIAIDDLRPALGCYDDPVAKTPRIDGLAKRGVVFRRAYCQQAVCSPSRSTVMTGLRPDSIKVWDLGTHFRVAKPDAQTLPQYLKSKGYHTRSIGKIFHGGGVAAKDPPSWSEPPLLDIAREAKVRYALPKNLKGSGLKREAAEKAAVSDDYYIDGQVCGAAEKALEELKNGTQPFFLAVGFRKPHLPFCAPEKYWKLYEREEIPEPSPKSHPIDAPELATRSWMELEGYTDISRERPLPDAKVRELRHGYYACVSYIDALVGRLLDRVRKLDLEKETIVCLWGDHGFHLGEQGLWTKANNYELSTRVPLIISVPGKKPGVANGLVELVDLYPTLVDLCELKVPEGLQGMSLGTQLDAPGKAGKAVVFSQFPRSRKGNRYRGGGDLMGYVIRTDRFRYVEWREGKTGKVLARELYDHERDSLESRNVVGDEGYRSELERLRKILASDWPGGLPGQ